MKQTDKELQFKDLCARLPYGVMLSIEDFCDKYNDKLFCLALNPGNNLYINGLFAGNNAYDSHVIIKPYLRPLSDMTKEELFEVQEILGKNEIKIDDGFLRIVDSNRKTFTYLEILALIDWFYKNHFDIHDLIPKGLAIKAPDGMYN